MELQSLLAAGNTQPGGFYTNGLDSMTPRRPDTPRDSGSSSPRFGRATTQLFGTFVEESVARGGSSNHRTAARDPPARDWNISEELMHVPWGSVLRSLEPAAANRLTPAASAASMGSARLVPAMGSANAQAYTHAKGGQRIAAAPGAQVRYSALSARPPTLPESSPWCLS